MQVKGRVMFWMMSAGLVYGWGAGELLAAPAWRDGRPLPFGERALLALLWPLLAALLGLVIGAAWALRRRP